MSKRKFVKRKVATAGTGTAATADTQLERLRKQAAARLLKRRRRKSGQ